MKRKKNFLTKEEFVQKIKYKWKQNCFLNIFNDIKNWKIINYFEWDNSVCKKKVDIHIKVLFFKRQ